MEQLERALKESFERQSPSPGFAVAVMDRVRARRRLGKAPLLRWALAGAIATSLLIGVYAGYRRSQRERDIAESARGQLVLSLQIAGSKVNRAREMILHSTKEDSL